MHLHAWQKSYHVFVFCSRIAALERRRSQEMQVSSSLLLQVSLHQSMPDTNTIVKTISWQYVTYRWEIFSKSITLTLSLPCRTEYSSNAFCPRYHESSSPEKCCQSGFCLLENAGHRLFRQMSLHFDLKYWRDNQTIVCILLRYNCFIYLANGIRTNSCSRRT